MLDNEVFNENLSYKWSNIPDYTVSLSLAAIPDSTFAISCVFRWSDLWFDIWFDPKSGHVSALLSVFGTQLVSISLVSGLTV